MLDHFTHQEIAVLLATRYSDSAQSAQELALNAETDVESVGVVLASLTEKGILSPYDDWDMIRYCYQDNDGAQRVYEHIHQLS